MSAQPHRHLRVVTEQGEVLDECPGCAELTDVVAGLERDIRGWAARYAELKRDLERDAKNHELWEQAEALFREWRFRCRHPRSKMTADRFWLIEPFLRRHGLDLCRRAIAGAAFDPMTKIRKNGSLQRFDSLDLIFRSESHFESFVNRAPRDC